MNKQQITQELEWTPDEMKEWLKKKKEKANTLLHKLIYKGDEEGVLLLLFDKTLEVNAEIHSQDYTPLNLAIKKGLMNIIKACYQNPESKFLNINRKNNKNFYENLAESNSPEIYDFFEKMKHDKTEMLSDVLFYALGYGQLKMIKHLINKKINDQYVPVDLKRAIIGYSSVDKYNEERIKNLFEYTSFFADIENQTQNIYINEKSKEIFFNSELLNKIILKQDEESFDLYKKIVSKEQMIKDIASICRNNDDDITDEQEKIIEGLKWFFLKEPDIDFAENKTIALGLSRSQTLEEYYKKIELKRNLNEKLPIKDSTDKKFKI